MSAFEPAENGSGKIMLRGLAHIRSARSFDIQGSGDVRQHIIDIARDRAYEPEVFDERSIFPWIAEASSNVIDFYGTRMMESTLENFQRNLIEGVSFMNSHSTKDYIGRSVDGWRVKEDAGNRDDRLIGGFYTVRGLQLGNMPTDDFIDGVRAGILTDVSVGFYANDIRCSICDRQIFDWWNYFVDPDNYCPHVPLEEYPRETADGDPVLDENGNPVMEMAIGQVYDGQLVEVSAVYEGAAPGAQIEKAEEFARQGLISPASRRRLEARYRVKLPDKQGTKTYSYGGMSGGAGNSLIVQPFAASDFATLSVSTTNKTSGEQAKRRETEMAEIELKMSETVSDELREMLRSFDVQGEIDEVNINLIERIVERWSMDRDAMAALEVGAQLGLKYKNDLIEDALKAGVRAKGQDFRRASYETILRGLDVEAIKIMRDDWNAEGDDRLSGGDGGSPGGRQSEDGKVPVSITERKSTRGDVAHLG